MFELAGQPTVYYELRDYRHHPQGKEEGIKTARADIGFMFKAFETGQTRPPRGRKTTLEEAPRIATIHEYLDWTVTAEDALGDNELDFGGFRVVALLPRFKPGWVPPRAYEDEAPKRHPELGAPAAPLPALMPNGKPICSAVIRAGPGFLEVPFFATQDSRRNKGYGRALLQAIEEIARACKLPYLLLCSTDDPDVKATWRAMGFLFSSEEDLQKLGVQNEDLLHMDNTVQMHKPVPPARIWRSVVFTHEHWRQRLYWQPTEETGVRERLARQAEALAKLKPSKRPAKKSVAKKGVVKTNGKAAR
ncbi:hypothetical protein WJX75_004529 [Coccomyxa subellipsoidea]|uniref:N-acetyltransferase domain-containing protein n=1 Tax=Coccomyxa subellipsoidea TaxID=248742 RepID=A0ABR2YVI2_9CHLO